ncbi:DUF6932 family protein [[Pseudomonas] boreopolis]|uniref:DUF6932 family protein n=1 Tax=Xanthomonas boreopolis TaxID=86183 RepID=UPI003DA03F5C
MFSEGGNGIPALDEKGLLPPGVWNCTLSEAEAVFCSNPRRRELWTGLQQFLDAEVRPHGNLPVWIDGSFTRRKDHPNDIDVVVDFSECQAADAIQIAISLYLRNTAIKATYHIDAYPRHPAIPQDLSAYFQYAGPKVAAELHVDERQRKGILRVLP